MSEIKHDPRLDAFDQAAWDAAFDIKDFDDERLCSVDRAKLVMAFAIRKTVAETNQTILDMLRKATSLEKAIKVLELVTARSLEIAKDYERKCKK